MRTGPPVRDDPSSLRRCSLPGRLGPQAFLLLSLPVLLLFSCRTRPPGLRERLQRFQGSLTVLGGSLEGELRRADRIPRDASTLAETTSLQGFQRSLAATGGSLEKEIRRAGKAGRFLEGVLEGELRRGRRLQEPSPQLWDYLGGEPGRLPAAWSTAAWLWREEWARRLARDPMRVERPLGPEAPLIPRPLAPGQALLLSLPIW